MPTETRPEPGDSLKQAALVGGIQASRSSHWNVATVGPSIADIAPKWKDESKVDELVAVVKAGKTTDQLSWGKIPMPASPVAEDNIRVALEWMLDH